MHFLHSMLRVYDLEKSLQFIELLGLKETRRKKSEKGRFTLIFLETKTKGDKAQLELTYNWDHDKPYAGGPNFGHLAFGVENIYEICHKLQDNGIKILRPPRDGYMAFVRSPDQISIELLQMGSPLSPQEPWTSMPSTGGW